MRPKFHEGFKLIATVLSTGCYLTACNITGYDTRKHGIRYTKARDTIQPTRDTIHRFHGMRYIDFTGYDTHNKCLKWPGALTQKAFQDYEKIN
jgi:hypothetical protein